jgi:hypothetical protein
VTAPVEPAATAAPTASETAPVETAPTGAGATAPVEPAADAPETERVRPAPDPDRRTKVRRTGSRKTERAAAQPDTGYFSVDALPYAEIYIDGALAGITPLVRVPLRPGKHSIRAVAESGASERITITVRSGETVSRRIRLETIRP